MTQHPYITLSLHNITLHRGGYCVLENVNAQFKAGTCTVLLGANGSGKTTLLRAISGLLPITEGKIASVFSPLPSGEGAPSGAGEGNLYNSPSSGTSCHLLPKGEGINIAQMVHFIANEGGLKLSFTVAEQIGFWCSILGGNSPPLAVEVGGGAFLDPPQSHSVRQLPRKGGAGVSHEISHTIGLKSLLNTSISKLSAGQKRRLSLAKLLCAPRPIWCLDEPTNALDSKGLEILRALMQKHCAQNGIIIAATHVSPLIEGEKQLNMGDFFPVIPA